jgi:hypothetical protein
MSGKTMKVTVEMLQNRDKCIAELEELAEGRQRSIIALQAENERLKEILYDPCTEARIINDAIGIGVNQGMERAAEIVEKTVVGVDENGYFNDPLEEAAQAIRAEIKKGENDEKAS